MPAKDELLVYWGDDTEPTGVLIAAPQGLIFRYLSEKTVASRQISHSIPVHRGTTEHPGTFFENLLPDGIQRERLARRLGLSDTSTFAMLVVVGGDCAGALSSFHPARPAALANTRANPSPNTS